MVHVVFWGRIIGEPLISRMRAVPDVALTVAQDADALVASLPTADAIVMPGDTSSYSPAIAAAIARDGKRLRWLQLITAGYDGPALYGVPPGVTVSVPGGNSRHVVAEHAMALMLALARGIPASVAGQARATWDRSQAPRLTTLEGRTLVIVGFGYIGTEIARRARAFDMRIVAVSRRPVAAELAESLPMSAWPAILSRADALALSVPLVPETRHLMNAAAFQHCKPNLLLVNIARGGLIDQVALADALASGRIAGAGLDVTDPEPLPQGDPLWQAPNLLISPHVAGAGSPRSRELMIDAVVANLQRFVANEPLQAVITL